MAGRQVEVVVTNVVVGDYEARSYPDEQADAAGHYNLYSVPVYKILVTGTVADNVATTTEFMAPRFMPFFNDPKHPHKQYKARGWLNAGLSSRRRVVISTYKPDYAVQNRYSPGRGAIVVRDAFYIHAGPASLQDVGFGSAGCTEIVGDYNLFKKAIADMSGFSPVSPDGAIQQLVTGQKLIVTIQPARPPDIKSHFTRKFP